MSNREQYRFRNLSGTAEATFNTIDVHTLDDKNHLLINSEPLHTDHIVDDNTQTQQFWITNRHPIDELSDVKITTIADKEMIHYDLSVVENDHEGNPVVGQFINSSKLYGSELNHTDGVSSININNDLNFQSTQDILNLNELQATTILVDTVLEKTLNNGVDIETVHLEDGNISNVVTLTTTTLDTTNIKSTAGNINLQDNLDFDENQILNLSSLDVDTIQSITNTKVDLLDNLDMNEKDILNAVNIDCDNIQSTTNTKVNISDNLDLQTNDILNVTTIKLDTIESVSATVINTIHNIDMNEKDILNAVNIDCDNIQSTTNTKVNISDNLDLQTNNIQNVNSIDVDTITTSNPDIEIDTNKNIHMNGGDIYNLPAVPPSASSAVSKTFFDNQVINSSRSKANCRLATTGNITLSAHQTIDGFLTVENDRILVYQQTDATKNGIYDAKSTAWVRSLDLDNAPSAEIYNGVWTVIDVGNTLAGFTFRIISVGTGIAGLHTINTDNIDWDNSHVNLVAGDGISKVADTISVDYNTTNLKITSQQLNTIQDLSTTSNPVFTSAQVEQLNGRVSNDLDINTRSGQFINFQVNDVNIMNMASTGLDMLGNLLSNVETLTVNTINEQTLFNGVDIENIKLTSGVIENCDSVQTDLVIEKTLNNGVDVDGVLLKDGDVSCTEISCNSIVESTPDNGVLIDTVLIKDGNISEPIGGGRTCSYTTYETGTTMVWNINGTPEMILESTRLGLQGNDINSVNDISCNTVTERVVDQGVSIEGIVHKDNNIEEILTINGQTLADLILNARTGRLIEFNIGGITEAFLDSGQLGLQGNNITAVQQMDCNIINERTTNSGVTVEGVLHRDNNIEECDSITGRTALDLTLDVDTARVGIMTVNGVATARWTNTAFQVQNGLNLFMSGGGIIDSNGGNIITGGGDLNLETGNILNITAPTDNSPAFALGINSGNDFVKFTPASTSSFVSKTETSAQTMVSSLIINKTSVLNLQLNTTNSVIITLDADTDNVNETHLPLIWMKGDGGAQQLFIGQINASAFAQSNGTTTGVSSNSHCISACNGENSLSICTGGSSQVNGTERLCISDTSATFTTAINCNSISGTTIDATTITCTGISSTISPFPIGTSGTFTIIDSGSRTEIKSTSVGGQVRFYVDGNNQRMYVDNTGLKMTSGSDITFLGGDIINVDEIRSSAQIDISTTSSNIVLNPAGDIIMELGSTTDSSDLLIQGLFTGTPTYFVRVQSTTGNARVERSLTCDERMKTDIVELSPDDTASTDLIKNLNTYKYKYRTTEQLQEYIDQNPDSEFGKNLKFGGFEGRASGYEYVNLIAQDLKTNNPELVYGCDEMGYDLETQQLVGHLLQAVKNLTHRLEIAEQKIYDLENPV